MSPIEWMFDTIKQFGNDSFNWLNDFGQEYWGFIIGFVFIWWALDKVINVIWSMFSQVRAAFNWLRNRNQPTPPHPASALRARTIRPRLRAASSNNRRRPAGTSTTARRTASPNGSSVTIDNMLSGLPVIPDEAKNRYAPHLTDRVIKHGVSAEVFPSGRIEVLSHPDASTSKSSSQAGLQSFIPMQFPRISPDDSDVIN